MRKVMRSNPAYDFLFIFNSKIRLLDRFKAHIRVISSEFHMALENFRDQGSVN